MQNQNITGMITTTTSTLSNSDLMQFLQVKEQRLDTKEKRMLVAMMGGISTSFFFAGFVLATILK